MLAGQYDCVVANPPYMGSKYFNALLKAFVDKHYQGCQSRLVCMLHRTRTCIFAKPNGFVG